MAFGDLVQPPVGGSSVTTIAIPAVQAGNTLLFIAYYRSWEGGEPTSVTDNVNAGAYTKVFDYGSYGQNTPQISCYMLANTAAGATTITAAGTLPFRWGLLEVEGVLVPAGVGTGNFSTTASATATAAPAVAPDNSVIFGGFKGQIDGNNLTPTQAGWVELHDFSSVEVWRKFVTTSSSVDISGPINNTAGTYAIGWEAFTQESSGSDYIQRKGSTFDATHTLGTITTATLNAVNVFDHVSSQAAGTISFAGALTDEITTSGEVDLVLGDGAATQTQTVQVNVFGVVPSNNPAQKDGAALASLTGIQIRITAGANLNGTQVYYSGTEATDASGNFSNLDVSTSAAVAADPVRMQVLTAAGDSITSAETVGLI
jgi:hypothetical protein